MDVNFFLSNYPNGAFISTFVMHGYEYEFICTSYDDAVVACNDLFELIPPSVDFVCFVREIKPSGDIIDHYEFLR